MDTELTFIPQQIYTAAVGAAGPAGDNLQGWADRVDEIGALLLQRYKLFVRRSQTVQKSITLTGIVTGVDENPVSEGGKKLTLFRIYFRADAGERPDPMWLDKTKPGDVAMFRTAQSLINKRATIVKESRIQYNGDTPAVDPKTNQLITRPYLASIQPADSESGEAGPGAGPSEIESQDAPVSSQNGPRQESGAPSHGGPFALSTELPDKATDVVRMAGEAFGLSAEEVKSLVTHILGPNEGGRRSTAQIRAAWRGIEVIQLAQRHFGLSMTKVMNEVVKAIRRSPKAPDHFSAEEFEKAWNVIYQGHQTNAA